MLISVGKFTDVVAPLFARVKNFCSPAISTSLVITTTTTIKGSKKGSLLDDDPFLGYVIIGTSCGIGILICAVCVLCCSICLLSIKKKGAVMVTSIYII